MKRRIALLAGTFLTLLVAYAVYHFSTGGMERWLSGPRVVEREKVNLSHAPPPANTGSPGYDRRGTGLTVENRDPKTGRLEGVFVFPRWEKQDDGSYLVEEPNVVIYHKGGERTYVFARSGRVEVEELARQKFDVRNGELRGDVTIWFDRNPGGPPPDSSRERMREIVRVYTDDIRLDRERLIMRTDSRIVLFSDKADLYGNGLIIRWREAPQELMHLEIPRGGQMYVYEMPEDFGAPLPGPGGAAGSAPVAGKKASATGGAGVARPGRGRATGLVNRLATGESASTSASAPASLPAIVSTSGPVGASLPGPASLPATLAAASATGPRGASLPSAPAASSLPARQALLPAGAASGPARGRAPLPPPSNVYRAEFHDRVRVDYPLVRKESNTVDVGHVEGADVLALVFQWDANTRRRVTGPSEEEREAQRQRMGPVSQPGSGPASGPSSLRAASGMSGTVALGTATSQGAAAREGKAKPKPTDPMVITWSGPLTLEPFGYTEEPSSQQYEITADGERVLLSDSRSVAVCRHFRYASPEQEGELDGSAAAPARLLLADGVDAVCAEFQYQRDRNVALLRGRGHMTARPGMSAADLQVLAWEPPPLDPDANVDSIRWNDSATARFAADERGLATGRSIQEANFVGGVRLVQASSGDFVGCDSLQASFALDEANRPYPQKAVAVGSVSAREGGSEISSGRLEVTFQPAPRGSALSGSALAGTIAGEPAGPGRTLGSPQFGRIQPVSLLAEGNVVVVDGNGPDQTIARADRLTSDLLKQTAVLWGEPNASIVHGENQMFGREIHVKGAPDPNIPDQSANIEGPGTLVFLIRRDLNGTELKTPRPVRIAWAESMDYPSLEGKANFIGSVRLDSNSATPEEIEQDEMTCPTMQVIFAKGRPTSRPTSIPAPGPTPAQASGSDLASLPPGLPLVALTETHLLSSTRTSAAEVASRPTGRSGRPSRRANMSMESFGQPKVDKIIGNDGVVMRSSSVDPNGHLLRRLQVTGKQLVYDPNQVHVFGKGWMTAEDYRPPDANRLARAATQPAEDLQRPMQTAFWWDELMSLSQAGGEVVIEGNVQMVHHSGQYVLAEKINTPPWPALKGGRVMTLRSDRVQAFFAAPEPVAGAGGKSAGLTMEGGPRIGQLTRFTALGGVRMVDGFRKTIEINGQQVEYSRALDIVRIFGNLPGHPEADAVMSFKDPDAGPYGHRDPIVSPWIIWYRATGRIEAKNFSGWIAR